MAKIFDFDLDFHSKSLKIKDINSLKELFFVRYPDLLSDGTLPVLNFVSFLTNHNTLAERIRTDLQNWLENTVKNYNLKARNYSKSQLEQLHPYLVIIIKGEDKQANQCRMKAYLIPSEKNKKEIEPIPITNIKYKKKGGFSPEDGVLCEFDKISENINIPKIIEDAAKIMNNKTNEHWKLTVEFFLPIQHLNKTVEEWKYEEFLSTNSPLWAKSRVFVRSFDRFKYNTQINNLRDGRQRLSNLRKKLNAQIIQKSFEPLEDLNSVNWKNLKNTLEKRVGLKLSCPPQSVSDKMYQKLFQYVIISGIPIAIWTRSIEISNKNEEAQFQSKKEFNPEEEFKKILTIDSLKNCCNLENIVYEKHQKRDVLGYHIVVLCEEPNIEDFPDLKAAIMNF